VDHKILDMLPSGTPLTLLDGFNESEKWTRVRTDDGKEGWVVTAYLTNDPPKGPLLEAARKELEALRARYEELKEEIASSTADRARVSEEADEYRARLQAVEQEFAAWKQANKDVIALRARAEALEKEQKIDRAELEHLRVENQSLQAREKFYWFFSGVVVLLLGWVLGYVYASSRHRAKSQSRFKF
jgi:SH3 domain protein